MLTEKEVEEEVKQRYAHFEVMERIWSKEAFRQGVKFAQQHQNKESLTSPNEEAANKKNMSDL